MIEDCLQVPLHLSSLYKSLLWFYFFWGVRNFDHFDPFFWKSLILLMSCNTTIFCWLGNCDPRCCSRSAQIVFLIPAFGKALDQLLVCRVGGLDLRCDCVQTWFCYLLTWRDSVECSLVRFSMFVYLLFPEQCVHTKSLRGSCGRCKGRCLIRVLQLGRALLPVNFRMHWLWRHFSSQFTYKVALVKCWGVFRLRRLAQNVGRGFGPRHFCFKFPYAVALATCWSAFRLCRLAQSVCPRSGLNLGRGIFPVNFCKKWVLWHVDLYFDCAGSHKVCVGVLGSNWAAALFL